MRIFYLSSVTSGIFMTINAQNQAVVKTIRSSSFLRNDMMCMPLFSSGRILRIQNFITSTWVPAIFKGTLTPSARPTPSLINSFLRKSHIRKKLMFKFPQNMKMCYPLIIKVVCADNDRTFSSGVRLDPVLILGFIL